MQQNIHFPKEVFLFRLLYLILSIITISAIPISAQAQMFSVEDSQERQFRPLGYYTIFGASLEFGDFSYTGTGANENQRVDFNSSILRFRFDTPGLDLNLGFGGSLTGMDNTSYASVMGRLHNDINIRRRSNFSLALPVQLTTDLKSVRRGNSDAEFQQNSFTFGTGISSALRLNNTIDFSLRATPNYGFSFAQGNLFGGSLFRFDGKAQFVFYELIGSDSFSLAYHFDYRSYNIDGDLNDYNYISHSVTLGYAF